MVHPTRTVTSAALTMSTCIVETNKWDPKVYMEHAAHVPKWGFVVLDLLQAKPGERILDLGCGDGVHAAQLKRLGCDVVGVDASQEMVDAAKANGLTAFCMDGQRLSFDNEFDAVVSNCALHWMKQDPVGAIKGVRKALKPGARFVADLGGCGSVGAIITALYGVLKSFGIDAKAVDPWFLPAAEQYKAMLENQGFVVDSIELIPIPTLLETDMKGWLQTFANNFFEALPVEQREQALMDTVEALRPSLQRWDGSWVVHYVQLRFRASLPVP